MQHHSLRRQFNFITPGASYPADQYSDITHGYSLDRYISSSYSGDVIEVRRTSDSSTRGFNPTEIYDGTLLAWVGTSTADDGRVTKFYDQVGSLNLVTLRNYDPYIVIQGVQLAGITFGTARGTGTLAGEGLQVNFPWGGATSLFQVYYNDTTQPALGNHSMLWFWDGNRIDPSHSNTSYYFGLQNGNPSKTIPSGDTQNKLVADGLCADTNKAYGIINGNVRWDDTLTATLSSGGTKYLGILPYAIYFQGYVKELLYAESDMSGSASDINQEQMEFYSI